MIITDTIMFLLFAAVTFLGLSFLVEGSGGWFTAIRELAVLESKPGIISWHGVVGVDSTWKTPADAMIWAVILGFAWGIVVAVSPWQASRYLMARDEHTVVRSATITAGVIMMLYLVLMLAGAAVNLINPAIEPAQENMIWAAMNAMPTLVGVLIMAGIMAAGLSSASTFLSLSGFSISNDLTRPKFDDDRIRLRQSRLAMFSISVTALIIAWLLPEGKLFWVSYFAGTLFASSWGPVAFMSVWSRRITEAGAFWGIIAGLVGNVLTNVLLLLRVVDLPVILDPILVGVVLSYVTIELVSSNGVVSEQEHERRERLHRVPDTEIDGNKFRRTLFWARLLMVFGVFLSGLMIVFYAIPYGKAVGHVAVGEILLSMGVGLALVVTGALAWWGTSKSIQTT